MDSVAKIVGAFFIVCVGLALLVGAFALVKFSETVPKPETVEPARVIVVPMDRDGRPQEPYYMPYYTPTPAPLPNYRYPHRPGNSDTGAKGKSET